MYRDVVRSWICKMYTRSQDYSSINSRNILNYREYEEEEEEKLSIVFLIDKTEK